MAPLLALAVLAAAPTPVLVELFTSEGCSSCPPADALLRQLQREQPLPGVELVTLSEHVTYWDDLGWKDPFSAPAFTRRQQAYAGRLSAGRLFTPQAVVAGEAEVVGSDRRAVLAAASAAAARAGGTLRAVVAPDGAGVRLDASWPGGELAQVWLALADREVATEVLRGENRGRTLRHGWVARRLTLAGEGRGRYQGTAALPEAPGPGQALVAFVQGPEGGRVLAATVVGPPPSPAR